MLWIKSFHIVAVVCWFAVLFYLPRLFVYHAMTDDQPGRERFKIMERKLYRGIGTPSILATYIFGIWTASYAWSYYSASLWFWLKIALVALLTVYHHLCGMYLKRFRNDELPHNHVFFRWFNEFPVLMLIAIVLLAVLKPVF